MTWQEIVDAIVKLEPAEVELVDRAIHAMLGMRAMGMSEEDSVAAARGVARAAVDVLEQKETPK